MGVEVRLLGPTELVVDGTAATPPGARPRAVLAVVAAAGGSPPPADRLADAVYSDTGRPATRTTVQVHVHTLRQALGEHRADLRHTPAGYQLHAAAVDLRAAEDAIARARAADRAGDVPGAATAYRRALALWRGDFCADLPDHTALAPARALYAALRWEALEARIAVDLRAGAGPALIPELEALVADNPLRERLWAHLVVALHRDGRHADALAHFARARRALADEAGLDPGPALRALEHAVRSDAGTATLLRLVAPAAVGSRPALTWIDGTGHARHRELPTAGRLTLGRDPSADIPLLHDAAVSRAHAQITAGSGGITVTDLGSRNGTFHNGTRLTGPATLTPGDHVRCGDTVLSLTSGGPELAITGTTR